MKFKVGDKVRVVKIVSNPAKNKHLGKILTIKSLNPNGDYTYDVPHYGIEEEEVRYVFFETELELFEFTKADLKDGMVVEYRDGNKRVVLGDKLMGENCYLPLRCICDDLTGASGKCYDIVKVYTSSAHTLHDYCDSRYLTLIWEAPAKKMTVAEIEKELGYKVEIVSEGN